MKARGSLPAVCVFLCWAVCSVSAVRREHLFPYGTRHGDSTLQEGDDETSEVLELRRPLYFYETQFSALYVATNGIISTQDLPMEKQYVDDGFPTDFPVIAPFLADIDTSRGRGAIYYRMEESPGVLTRVAQEVQRSFPGTYFTPTHAVIATWENVAAYEEVSRNSAPSSRVNTFQAVVAYDDTDSYALFLYPEDGLQFFGTRPKESYNVQLELPARVGFCRGEVSFLVFSRTEGPYYSVTSNEQTVKNLYQVGNTGVPGLWLFRIGNRFSFQNVVPAAAARAVPTAGLVAQDREATTTPDYAEVEYPDDPFSDPTNDYYPTVLTDSEFPPPAFPEYLEPGHSPTLLRPSVTRGEEPESPASQSHLQPYGGDVLLSSGPELLPTQPLEPPPSGPGAFPLPEPRQLPHEDANQPSSPAAHLDPAVQTVYRGRDDVLEGNPPHGPDHYVVSVDEDVDFETGVIQYSTENKETCARFQQTCSQNGYCTDYSSGFCCHCHTGYYGNGRHCLPEGAPQRVNGKVNGLVSVGATPVELDNVDLHAYIVMGDGRAYTAISQVPEPIGWALMPMAPIGGLYGWLFALELPHHQNGFRITGAEFTHYTEAIFYPGNQRLTIVQTAQSLSPENYLSMNIHIRGSVPFVVPGATVQMEPYKEIYQYYPSVITSSSVRDYTVVSLEKGSETYSYQLRQNITYRDCRHGPRTSPESQQLSMERIFIMYDKEERILRYAITNKIGPLREDPHPEVVNPCYAGTHDCDTTAQCLPGEGEQFRCQCATGYRGDGRSCHDIDECTSKPCHAQAFCLNSLGSFECRCRSGFRGDGFNCLPQSLRPERPKTRCEQHRDSLQGGLGPRGPRPAIGAFVPQCDEEGQYRPLQCHGSTGYCWCVDSGGQEREGTRTPPGAPPTDCDKPVQPERPKTRCEQHRDSLQAGYGGRPLVGAFVPQCDEEGQYRPLQCHGSTGYCWCVDSGGQEREGTRTPPGAPPTDCDKPEPPPLTPRPETVCERWRASLVEYYRGQPTSRHYLPQCDSAGQFVPLQCYSDTTYCWCVDKDGTEVPGTRSHDAVKPPCVPTVPPPTVRPLPRPDVTPPPSGTSLLYAQGQQIGALPLNGTRMEKAKASVLLALHGSIVVGIDYNCQDRKVYWTDLSGRTINRASLESGAEPETIISTGLTSPEGLAVDARRSMMFWVDSGPDKIESCRLDGRDRKVLFDTDLVNPRAIIVDSASGTLYWTDWNRDAPKIESSTVEGHGRRVVVRDGIGLPNALTFDPSARQICWADAGTKRLECIAPDGTGRRVINSNLNYPFSLVSYANHFYYTDWRRDGVIALNRDSGQFTDEYLPDQRSHLYGITVASPSCL
ncbi:nidogen-2 isoform X2 [Scleropages formosus]|uniref:nidogen-2 isoform X2 n=1 Tax=Scleropages formosus TaxID=113540 RepID=UPI0008791848|nr:nidogen-2 isoform X2 [Scleropages formosus]